MGNQNRNSSQLEPVIGTHPFWALWVVEDIEPLASWDTFFGSISTEDDLKSLYRSVYCSLALLQGSAVCAHVLDREPENCKTLLRIVAYRAFGSDAEAMLEEIALEEAKPFLP